MYLLRMQETCGATIQLDQLDSSGGGADCLCSPIFGGFLSRHSGVDPNPLLRVVDCTVEGGEGGCARVMSDADAHDTIERTLPCSVEKVPSPTEIRLKYRMKVWGLQLPSVGGYKPGGNTKSPAQGDAQVSKVAANARTTRERLKCRGFAIAAASQVFHVLVDPVTHCRHALMPGIMSSKLTPGKMPELIRLAVAAWIKIGQR